MNDTEFVEHLLHAKILVELGELFDAEFEVAALLDDRPEDLDALSLLAKIKHMRGQLSQAIGCWAQIHQQTPLREAGLLHLRSIMQLAQDPERGAGDFLVLGQHQIVRKPAAHLEFEEGFRLYLARNPTESTHYFNLVADRYRTKDREMYKLAVLASAYVSELSGQLEEACRRLEKLGEERGFETDNDRILGLVRLYERLGGKRHLEAAVQICRFVERTKGGLSILARLSALHARLNDGPQSEEYARRYLAAFRQRMHRATHAELVHVAANVYLPLDRLRAVRVPKANNNHHSSTERETAIAHALLDEFDKARDEFEALGTPLDRKYLADVEVLAGNEERAVALYIGALNEDPSDLRIIERLLDRVDGPATRTVQKALRADTVATTVREALETAVALTPLRPSLWRHLAAFRNIEHRHDEALRCFERAQALDAARRRDRGPLGRVLAAGVYHFVGRAKGLIHEVWADREVVGPGLGGTLPAANVLGNLTGEMRQSVQNTFISVREYARSKLPHLARGILDFNYSYKVTKEDEPSGGLSAGLPTALAFLSVFVQRPVPQDIAATGHVIADSHDVLQVRPIGDSEHKVKAAYNRNLRAIVLPAGNRAELSQNVMIPAEVQRDIVRYAADFDEAVGIVFGTDLLGS